MVINVLIISSDTDAAEQTALDPKKQTSLLLSVLAPVIIACTPSWQGIPKLLVNRDRDVYGMEAGRGNSVVQTYCMGSQKPPLSPAQARPIGATRWVHRHIEHLQQIPLLSRNPAFRLVRGKKKGLRKAGHISLPYRAAPAPCVHRVALKLPLGSVRQHWTALGICAGPGPSRTRVSQEQIYKTLLSVIFHSIIPEGNHITRGINKENRAGGRKGAVQKCTRVHKPLSSELQLQKIPNLWTFLLSPELF